jgi:hypothetical protein
MKNFSPPSSGFKSRHSNKPAWNRQKALLHVFSETSVDCERTIRRCIPEDRTLDMYTLSGWLASLCVSRHSTPFRIMHGCLRCGLLLMLTLRGMDGGCVAGISQVHAASTFRVEVCRIGECSCICRVLCPTGTQGDLFTLPVIDPHLSHPLIYWTKNLYIDGEFPTLRKP